MTRREKCLKLAEVLSLASAKTRELANDSLDGVSSREMALAHQLEGIAEKFRALAQEELANPITN